jgi:uncharacterized protein Yka (UPF0111/DUF47 family)
MYEEAELIAKGYQRLIKELYSLNFKPIDVFEASDFYKNIANGLLDIGSLYYINEAYDRLKIYQSFLEGLEERELRKNHLSEKHAGKVKKVVRSLQKILESRK